MTDRCTSTTLLLALVGNLQLRSGRNCLKSCVSSFWMISAGSWYDSSTEAMTERLLVMLMAGLRCAFSYQSGVARMLT